MITIFDIVKSFLILLTECWCQEVENGQKDTADLFPASRYFIRRPPDIDCTIRVQHGIGAPYFRHKKTNADGVDVPLFEEVLTPHSHGL